ncbi:MAG TPA: hypothetical protein VFF62_03065 [Candidatus Nitrosocosmicus sp.]|nr:hypothetical protein [Candidatus Nitrosocosmicus sp.]
MLRSRSRHLAIGAAFVLLLLPTAPASAQLFFSTHPNSGFHIGPLIVRANVNPDDPTAHVNVLWSVVPPPSTPRTAGAVPQDFYLLWPGEVISGAAPGKPDAELAKMVTALGFDVIGEGRIPLYAQSLNDPDAAAKAEPVPGGVPYVTFVQSGGALGLSPPATWIRIPWTSRLPDPRWLMDLRFRSPSLIKPKKASWVEAAVLGEKYIASISFNEVRDRPLFQMYFAHRDRAVRLADAPAELAVNFSHSDELKIDEVFPRNTIRRLSESLESTEVVSLFLDTSEGIAPQQVTVQYGYFSKLQAAALVALPAIFLALGYAVGPALARVGGYVGGWLVANVRMGGWNRGPAGRETGTIVSPEVVARIIPGKTTLAEVLALCGPHPEQRERFAPERRRTLVYRGKRTRPTAGRVFGWFFTVRHLEVEEHVVTIEMEGDRVRDVQADVSRSRLHVGEPV